jgi:anti-sigma factor RsiW
MDCQQVQDEILEGFNEPTSADVHAAVDAHLAGCVACAAFARKQQALDRQLATVLAPPRLAAHVRAAIRERARRERQQFWSDLLPDAVHFASCAVVTIIALVLLPLSAPVVLGIGTLGTLLTHAVLTAFHESLDAADDLVT